MKLLEFLGSDRMSGALKVSFAVVALILLVNIFGSGGRSRSSTASSSSVMSTDVATERGATPKADAFTSASGAYMDDREKQLYERDPSSMGYTEADRDFIREHGMTEDEMRAAETILHEQGIDN